MLNLPQNRQLKKLGELCKIRTGKKDANYSTEDGLYPFFTCGKEILKAPNYSFDTEAILIAGNGDVGACKYYKGKFEAYQRTYVLDCFLETVDIHYIFHLLNGKLRKHALQESLGSAIPYIKLGTLQNFAIPLPPLEEQKKIVAYLDELNATITKLKAEYQSQLTALDEMRNSSLDLAFGGSREREWNLNNWKRVKLGEVCEKIQYGFTGKTSDTGKYKYLRITDIQNNIVDWESVPFVEIEESEAPKFLLNTGEIVFARTGATVGKSFLIGEVGNNKIFASYLIRLIPQYKQVKSDFLKYFFQSRIYWNQILTDAIGAAQPNFNGKKLSLLELPLPDLETQAKIVTHLDQVHQHITSLKAQVSQQIQHCDELWQSSLEQALSQGVKYGEVNSDFFSFGLEKENFMYIKYSFSNTF